MLPPLIRTTSAPDFEVAMNVDTAAIRRLRDHLLSTVTGDGASIRDNVPEPVARDAIRQRVEPFAETMYLVMVADGDPASVERRALIAAIDVLTDSQLSAADVDAMVTQFERNVGRDGGETRLAEIGARVGRDRTDRETAFMLGAVVALADDRIDVRENRALEWIKEYFGISKGRVDALLQTIA